MLFHVVGVDLNHGRRQAQQALQRVNVHGPAQVDDIRLVVAHRADQLFQGGYAREFGGQPPGRAAMNGVREALPFHQRSGVLGQVQVRKELGFVTQFAPGGQLALHLLADTAGQAARPVQGNGSNAHLRPLPPPEFSRNRRWPGSGRNAGRARGWPRGRS